MKYPIAISAGLLLPLLLVSCFMPSTKRLEHPQTHSLELERYVNAQQLTTVSLNTLNALQLRETYLRDPHAVIIRLKTLLDNEPTRFSGERVARNTGKGI